MTYEEIDAIINELFGEPNSSTGMYEVDSGNLQELVYRCLESDDGVWRIT